MQPVARDEHGVIRFKPNKIVLFMLDHGAVLIDGAMNRREGSNGLSLNILASMDFPKEDWEQFYQLIGYSVSGYGDLRIVSDESYNAADAQADLLRSK